MNETLQRFAEQFDPERIAHSCMTRPENLRELELTRTRLR
jgi:hypothetical protein